MEENNNLLRKEIDEFYRPSQLTEAILRRGTIPNKTHESFIGIAFLDIVDYSYISRFLTPNENLILLNGLYTAFHNIIIKRQGYLNKIEGDSMMFHFGGPLDHNTVELESDEARKYIVGELFRTCVEIQQACKLFNQANEKFVENATTDMQKQSLINAFSIIDSLRQQEELSNRITAFFQIRIRIGASIGDVTVGNTGPPGAKQWDVIGNPVIEAKRMESTAPVGGFRISRAMYEELNKYGHIRPYCEEFRKEASESDSSYSNIKDFEIFRYQRVVLQHKNNAKFETYSIQVDTSLPNQITEQVVALLLMGKVGAEKAVEIIMNTRGNQYIIDSVEERMYYMGINLHKNELLRIVYPKKYKKLLDQHQEKLENHVNKKYSLYEIFELLGKYQDAVGREPEQDSHYKSFDNFPEAMDWTKSFLDETFEKRKFFMVQRAYFYNFVLPMIRIAIQNCILEYQLYVSKDIEAITSPVSQFTIEHEEHGRLEELESV